MSSLQNKLLCTCFCAAVCFLQALNAKEYRTLRSYKSKTAIHQLDQEYYQGKPVYNSFRKISSSKLYSDTSYQVHPLAIDIAPQLEDLTYESYSAYVLTLAGYQKVEVQQRRHNKVYPYDALFRDIELLGSFAQFRSFKDTTASLKVFMPNPVASSGELYGNNLKDWKDSSYAFIEGEQQLQTSPVRFESGQFILENEMLKMVDLGSIENIVPKEHTPLFDYKRSQSEFESVNTYYHCWSFLNYLEDSLGIQEALTFQLQVDAHETTDDNSFFTAITNPPQLNFGDGGVDDAEDGHVILHELGHAIIYSANLSSLSGNEGQAVEEGICDYFASSYSRSLGDSLWYLVSSWDGHNEFWFGRISNSFKKYPDDYIGQIHTDGEIVSSVLMELEDVLGRNKNHDLIIEACSYFSLTMNMALFGDYLIKADSLLYGAVHVEQIRPILCKRGLYSKCDLVYPNYDKQVGIDFVLLADGLLSFTANYVAYDELFVYDMNGKLVLYDKDIQQQYFLNLSAGVYLVVLSGNSREEVIKIAVQ